MSLEYEKFKQFLQRRKEVSTEVDAFTAPLNHSSLDNYSEQALSSIKRLSSKHNEKKEIIKKRERRGPGRPTKREEDKVRVVSMKLPPQIFEEIKNLPFGKGTGSKVRELLAYFKYQEGKEIARAKLLQKLIEPFDNHLNNYLKLAKLGAQDPEALQLMEKLIHLAKKLQMMIEIFHWNSNDFRNYLHPKEVLTLQFALDFKREVCENRSFQQIL